MKTNTLNGLLAKGGRGLLTCGAVALLSLPVLAQQGPDDDPDTATGYVNNMFHHSSVDSINLYNGSLTIPIPIGPSYPVGPKLKFQAMLTYSSKVWEYGRPSPGAPPPLDTLWSPLVADPAIGLGWTFSLGAIKKCGLNQLSNCYVGPDGSEHEFSGMKSKDAAQLLLKGDDTNGWEMWDGDGNHYEFRDRVTGYDDTFNNYTHTLGRGRNGWYLSDLTDPFNNTIHATYHPNLGSVPCWGPSMVCQSSTGSASWIPATITGPSWSITVGLALDGSGKISSFSFPVGASSVTWTLGYGSVSLVQAEPNPASVNATTLATITLPTTSHPASYTFTYIGGGTGYLYTYGGLIQTMTLPTQGVISYKWSSYSFYHARRSGLTLNCISQPPPDDAEVLISGRPPAGIITAPAPEGPSLSGCTPGGPPEFIEYADRVAGIARRTESLSGQHSSTDYVQLAYPFGEQGTPTNRCDFRGCGSQTLTLAITPPGIDLKSHATATLFWGAAGTAPPRPGDRTGADIETRVFDFDPWDFPANPIIAYPACGTVNSFCPTKAVRVTQRTFEYDSPLPGNRRVLSEKTFHQAPALNGTCVGCKYTETVNSPAGSTWETNGRHYGTETRSGNLAGGALETKTTTTTWTPKNWATGPTGDDVVLPNLSSQVQTTEGSRTIMTFLEYDTDPTTANGFLKGRLTWDDVGDTAYVGCRFADTAGNVSSDLDTSFVSTGPSPPASAATYCGSNFTPGTSVGMDNKTFGKKYTYQNGQLLTARWINGTDYLGSWYARRLTRDPKTGRVTDSYDSAGVKTHYDYDNLGRVITITPDGETATGILYNSTTQTTATRSGGAGLSTWQRYEYDGLGRMIREKKTIPGGAIVKRFTLIDEAGHDYFHSEWLTEMSAETVSASQTTTCKYSDQGGPEANYTAYRPIAAAGTYTTCFDPFGRPQKVVGAKHNSIQTIYRTDGLSLHSDSLETVTSYCVNGWFTGATCNVTPPQISLTPVTTTKRDSFGRIRTVTEPNLDLTTYAYDTTNKLTSVTQTPQAARTFTYDASGNTKSENTPEKGAVNYSYGGLGNLLTELLPGPLTVSRSYDFAGRLTTVIAGGQTFVSNCYDGAVGCFAGGAGNYKLGKLTRRIGYNPASSPTATVTQDFTYSGPTGRLSSRSTSVSGGNLGLVDKWGYNSLGLLSNYWHPRMSGAPFLVSTVYDQGLPVTQYLNGIPMVRNVTYLNSGALKAYKTGLGTGHDVTTTINQDATQLPRPDSIGSSGASTNWASGTYFYDGAGNIMKTGSDTFSYDDRSRLLSAFYSGINTQFFCYDRWGNQTAKAFGASPSCSASWSTNRVPGGVYDARGNMTGNGGGESYIFDNLDRQVRHGTAWNYLFDGSSERVVKIPTSLGWTYTLRDEANRVATEYAGAVVSRDQVYLGNLLVASYANTAVGGNTYAWTYYSSDHLGSPRIVTDIAGTTRDTARYWPYGEEADVSIGPQRVRFASMERDTEASRFYDHARNHEFNLGRFLSPDTFSGNPAEPQSWNRYTYASNNPIAFTDPNGDFPWESVVRVLKRKSPTQSRIVAQVSRRGKPLTMKRIVEALNSILPPRRAVTTKTDAGARKIAKQLDLNGELVGPHPARNGYPEHYHPKSGPFTDVHVSAEDVFNASVTWIWALGEAISLATEGATTYIEEPAERTSLGGDPTRAAEEITDSTEPEKETRVECYYKPFGCKTPLPDRNRPF